MSALYSLEAEQSVLSILLNDPRGFDQIADRLKAEAFYDSRNRLLFSVLAERITKGLPVDPVEVWEHIKAMDKAEEVGGFTWVAEVAAAYMGSKRLVSHAAIVADRAIVRALLEALDQGMEIAKGPESIAAKLDAIGSRLAEIERSGGSKAPRRLGDLAVSRSAYYEELASGRVSPGFATGFGPFDFQLGGGLKPGHLVIIAARPSVGKSSFTLGVGIGAARKNAPGLFLSLEMPEEELTDRAIVHTGRVNYSAIQRGKFADEDWGRVAEGVDELGRLEFFIDDKPALSLLEIRSRARSIKGLKVLILDYLQLCDAPDGDTRSAQVGKISRGLKGLAKEMGICVIALSQLNRAVESRPDRRPRMSDLRDSGEIEQDADEVIFLWPLADDAGQPIRSIGMDLAKVRGGQTGTLVWNFEGAVQRWTVSTQRIDDFKPAASGRKGGFE